jgi:LacI family transcriptional regulator
MHKNVTLFDIADALGVSTGTVHRALHNHPGVNATTKTKVLQMAKTLGYRPNLAARFLSSKRGFRVSVNTPKGTTSFWDDVRAGIDEEMQSLVMSNVEIEYRTYPQQEEGEEEAFEKAIKDRADGIIIFPSHPRRLRSWIREASRQRIPVTCVVTDAPNSGRLAVVSIDTLASGSLAADLMGKFLRGAGKVAVTLNDLATIEHVEKYNAFETTIKSLYPAMQVLKPVEDHDVEPEAYEKSKKLLEAHPDLAGVYVTTEASIPVLRAARDTGLLDKLAIIATDLFPALVSEIRSGAVMASIYQRPRTQGRLAFRVLHDFLSEGEYPFYQVTLTPHLVVRGNLKFFLERQRLESTTDNSRRSNRPASDLSERLG